MSRSSLWKGSGVLSVDWQTWLCALSAAHIFAYSSHSKESVHSSLGIGLARPIHVSPRLIVVLGTVITPERLWINQECGERIDLQSNPSILASTRWRGEKRSMEINPVRSGVPIWETGYNWGDHVTTAHQMSFTEYDMHLTYSRIENRFQTELCNTSMNWVITSAWLMIMYQISLCDSVAIVIEVQRCHHPSSSVMHLLFHRCAKVLLWVTES